MGAGRRLRPFILRAGFPVDPSHPLGPGPQPLLLGLLRGWSSGAPAGCSLTGSPCPSLPSADVCSVATGRLTEGGEAL